MMSYEESAAEIRRRRDALISSRKKNIKKALTAMSVILLFTVIGGASFMIGVDRKDAPQKPPKVTVAPITSGEAGSGDGTSDLTDTESDPAPSESVTESDSQITESEPQTTESEPQTTESEPQTTESEPQTTESEPQTTESEPQTTESEPQTTESELATPEPEEPTESTDDVPPTVNTGGVKYEDYSASPNETPSETVKEKYTEIYSYKNYTYYFENTDMFYDGVSPLPIKTQKYRFDEEDLNDDVSRKASFKDYLIKLYGNEYDPENLFPNGYEYETDDEYVIDKINSWPEGYDALGRINYNKSNHMIRFDFDIGAVDGYFELNLIEALNYVKNMKYYKAALEHLGIDDPYIIIKEEYFGYTHSYLFNVYDRAEYFDHFDRTREKGSITISLSFTNYENDNLDRVEAGIIIHQPYDIFSVSESDTRTYANALNHILTSYDYGENLQYVKDNIKCIVHYNASIRNDVAPCYTFYVEYSDENGNKYYKCLGDYSLFEESTE